MSRPPIALTIAGTDPSGGAGIQADLKAFTARGAYGASAVTALVAQGTHGVSRVESLDGGFVAEQLDVLLDDLAPDATKTGMLEREEIIRLVAERAPRLGLLVVDPVMVATSGQHLLEPHAVGAMRDVLLPLADLVTPNLPEAALLLGDDEPEAVDLAGMRDQAERLLTAGPRAVLVKGGHLESGELVDVLALRGEQGVRIREFPRRRIDTPHTHGTGCTLSAAITAELARAASREQGVIEAAVATGLDYLARALRSGARWSLSREAEGSRGPVNHLVDLPQALARSESPLAPGDLSAADNRLSAGPHSAAAWSATAELRAQMDALPFLHGLADGSLALRSFVNYLIQDEAYLLGYSRALALLAARAEDGEEARLWAGSSGEAITVEREMHAQLLASPEEAEVLARLEAEGHTVPSPTTEGYRSWLIAQAATAPYAQAVAAVLPCYWMYAQIGEDLLSRLPGGAAEHPFGPWIAAYGDPEFAAVTAKAIAVYERLAERADAQGRQAMQDAFVRATLLERDFFSHAGDLRGWE